MFVLMQVFTEQLLELHKGQGMDIYWRDSYICPSEEQYKLMVKRSMSFIIWREIFILRFANKHFQCIKAVLQLFWSCLLLLSLAILAVEAPNLEKKFALNIWIGNKYCLCIFLIHCFFRDWGVVWIGNSINAAVQWKSNVSYWSKYRHYDVVLMITRWVYLQVLCYWEF